MTDGKGFVRPSAEFTSEDLETRIRAKRDRHLELYQEAIAQGDDDLKRECKAVMGVLTELLEEDKSEFGPFSGL